MKTNRDQSINHLLRDKGLAEAREQALRAEADCPDTEALAAFADDALTAAERQIVEAHVADCHRCQALTAAMVRMTIPPGEAAANRASSPWWKSRATLNWLVPATAAATALALWVAVPGQRSPATEESPVEIQTAATPPPAPADVDLFRPAAGARADNAARAGEAGAALDSTATADARPAAPADALSAPPAESSLKDENRLGRQEGVASEQAKAAPEPDRSFRDQAAPLAARAAASAAAGFEVASPDPRVRWRVGPGGPGIIVQSSADGGSTWVTQETGAPATLAAGSSPSPLVCWLVGRAGAVLRTTDGGHQWQRVAFPDATDLVAVSASSALAAMVNLADGRRLSTTDGGRIWTPVPK